MSRENSAWRVLAGLWLGFSVIALVLLLVGLIRPHVVEGRHPLTNQSFNVGLFRQCVDYKCDSGEATFSVWRASAALFIIGIIMLVAGTALVAAAIGRSFSTSAKLIAWAKILYAITNLTLLSAFVLMAVGFAWLDDGCPEDNQFQCNLPCAARSDTMGFFSLCYPWIVGDSCWCLFAALLCVFMGGACSFPLALMDPEKTPASATRTNRATVSHNASTAGALGN